MYITTGQAFFILFEYKMIISFLEKNTLITKFPTMTKKNNKRRYRLMISLLDRSLEFKQLLCLSQKKKSVTEMFSKKNIDK